MDRATMRDFQQPLLLLGRNTMGKMDGDIDPADTVRVLGHSPFRIDAQPIPRNVVSRAKLAREVGDTTCHRPDKQFDRTHSGILAFVAQGLIGDDAMFAARDVVASPAMIGRRKFHLPRHFLNLLIW
jgi:hypothetical protein